MNDRPENHEQEPAAPDRLVDALRSLHNQKLLVSPSVDEAILSEARIHLAGKDSVGVRPSSGAATPELSLATVSPETTSHTTATPPVPKNALAPELVPFRRSRLAAAEDSRTPVPWFRLSWGVLAAAAVVVL